MPDNEELKPCPFCGGRASRLLLGYSCFSTVFISCINDDCAVRPETFAAPLHDECEVYAAWNARAEEAGGSDA